MRKIKVYLQTPLSTSDSMYYKNIILYPPKNVKYLTNMAQTGIITKKTKFKLFNFAKYFLRLLVDLFSLEVPNIHLTKSRENYDLIHCAHCISSNMDKQWVADFEAPWQFWISNRGVPKNKSKVRKILNNKNCKHLIAWTEEAKKELILLFPELENKITVVSHAIPYLKSVKNRKNKIKLLFSGRYFYQKGGLHALEAIDRLTKKYENVNGIFISEVPEEIKANYSKNKKIVFLGLISQEKLFKEVYPSADIFIYPGYSDTFGFGFIEAMNFGLPIVTVDGYARKEIVGEKVGFVIPKKEEINPYVIEKKEEEIISEIVEKTSELIKNNSLIDKMSKNGVNEIKNGKFSIKRRNEKLAKIYSSSLE